MLSLEQITDRIRQMDLNLARTYNGPPSIVELLHRLADEVEKLVAENKQLREQNVNCFVTTANDE